jgi:hypothetical protein
MKARVKKIVLTFLVLLPAMAAAQQDLYYYHTIRSSSLAAAYGRTVKAHYAYQVTHNRQFKISGLFIGDEFSINNNRIESDIYNVNLQFQYNLIHKKKLFIATHLGIGGYLLRAEDLIGVKQKETNINLVGGFQAEYYIWRNNMALVVDYDIMFLPFSDVYEFLHVPTGGVGIYF